MIHSTASRGIALVATLAILLVVGLLVLASAVTGVIDRSISANQLRANAAYYVAQTGLDVYKTAVFRNLVDRYEDTGVGWCETPLEGGIVDGDGVVILAPGTWTEWTASGQGLYRTRLDIVDGYLVLTSEGEVGDGRSTVQLVAHTGGGPGSAWDNAILARGATPGSRAINGNVTIYGSVHIVEGHVEDIEGDVDFSGTAGIYNDYLGKASQANSNIVGPLSTIVATTDVNLCTRVKIAKGNVFAQGSVQLGTESEPIYSIHLGDGNVCQQQANTGTCRRGTIVTNHHDSNRVFLRYPEEAGINSPYAPGFVMDLPEIDEAAFDRAFQTTTLEGEIVAGCEWLYNDSGNAVLPPANPSTTSTMCGDGIRSVQWIGGSPGYLQFAGLPGRTSINISAGDLLINDTVLYAGIGTLLVGQGVDDADASISFGNSGTIRPLAPNTYPLVNAIGLLTTGDMTIGGTAAVDPFAALLYAKGTFRAAKQVIIVGAAVAEDFDLGNQVPKIAYHPDVRFAAEELCMPGTACAGDGLPQQRGALADIAIERR